MLKPPVLLHMLTSTRRDTTTLHDMDFILLSFIQKWYGKCKVRRAVHI